MLSRVKSSLLPFELDLQVKRRRGWEISGRLNCYKKMRVRMITLDSSAGLMLLLYTKSQYLQSVRAKPTVTTKEPEPHPAKRWSHLHSFVASVPPELQPLSVLAFS